MIAVADEVSEKEVESVEGVMAGSETEGMEDRAGRTAPVNSTKVGVSVESTSYTTHINKPERNKFPKWE
jgi:hypothetical protein